MKIVKTVYSTFFQNLKLILIMFQFMIGSLYFFGCQPNNLSPDSAIVRLTDFGSEITRPVFSPDGEQVLLHSTRDGSRNIYLLNLTDNKISIISDLSSDDVVGKWSPNGKCIAYMSLLDGNSFIKLFSITSGETITLSEGSLPNWSPNGEKLVFQKSTGEGKTDLYIWDIASKQESRLTDSPGVKYNFGWSYDGKWIGFSPRGTENQHLHVINVETKEKRQVAYNEDGKEWHPRWSNKEHKIAFYSTYNKEMTDVWVTSIDTGSLKRITDDPVEEYGPAWNNSEGLMAYFSEINGPRDVHIYNEVTDETISLMLYDLLTEISWTPLDWSPVSNALAIVANDKSEHIYSVDISAKKVEKLRPGTFTEDFASYDPSGMYLTYSGGEGPKGNSINIVNLIDKSAISITPEKSHQFNENPEWSPDGTKIGFIKSEGGAPDSENLWIVNRNGTGLKQLTTFGGVRNFVWASGDEFLYAYDSSSVFSYDIWKVSIDGERTPVLQTPASIRPTSVSPDGNHFLFFGDFDGVNKIYRMPVNGGNYEEIPNSTGQGEWPVYSPDGEQIAFLSNGNDERSTDIYIMPSHGGPATRITNDVTKEMNLSWSGKSDRILFTANYGSYDLWLVDVDRRINQLKY